MKMLGRLGWKGQCSCCNGPKWVKAEEKRQWRAEAELEQAFAPWADESLELARAWVPELPEE